MIRVTSRCVQSSHLDDNTSKSVNFDKINENEYAINKTLKLSAGFETAREDPNGFLIHRLHHSATTTCFRK